MTNETWKYRRETLGGLFRSKDIERRLEALMNRLGGEGWEIVPTTRSWLTQKYRLQFKRRVAA